jgi:hypothetical protein
MLEFPSSFLNSISNCCRFDKDAFIDSYQVECGIVETNGHITDNFGYRFCQDKTKSE